MPMIAVLLLPGSRMLFILRRAYAFGDRGLLAHIRPGFCVAVMGGVAEVVDTRPGVCPDDGVGGATHPRQRFRRVLIGAGLSCAGAAVSIRQARSTFALRRRRGGPSTVGGRPWTRIAVREAGATRTISACASRAGLRRVGARPEVGKARTTSTTRCPGRLRGSLRRRSIGTVVAVGQARATGALRDRRRRGGKRQYGEKGESNRRFHCPFLQCDERQTCARAKSNVRMRYQSRSCTRPLPILKRPTSSTGAPVSRYASARRGNESPAPASPDQLHAETLPLHWFCRDTSGMVEIVKSDLRS
jgi:hypothetical protein